MNSPWFLADDLSGALEVGGAWRGAGVGVRILLDEEGSQVGEGRWVRGVSCEVRNVRPVEVADRLASVFYAHGPAALAFVKVDSTMRGPIGAILAACRAVAPERPVLFCPANPSAGRTVVRGRLMVDGESLERTAFAKDPSWPVASGDVSDLLTRSGAPEAGVVGLDAVRAGPGRLARELGCVWSERMVALADAETEEDLRQLASAARSANIQFLPIGSGGLARAFGEAGSLPHDSTGAEELSALPAPRLFVVGSVHPASRSQLERLERAGVPVFVLDLQGDPSEAAESLVRLAGPREVVALTTRLSTTVGQGHEFARKWPEFLGRVVSEATRILAFGALVVTGGEVARAVFAALGGLELVVSGEYQPGVVRSRLITTRGGEMEVIVKPGGFGGSDCLVSML